jgi:hypothetical protein
MQLTGAWLSEAIEMDIDILAPISGRIGRYPSAGRGTPSWYGLIADTNMPTEMTPWHKFLTEIELGVIPEWSLFRQPSGLAPDAENLNWLLQNDTSLKLPIDHPARLAQGRKYYERYVAMYGEESDWVKRYVKAQYGDDPSGAAVFKNTFRSDFHIKPSTELIRGYPLIIGQDFGRNPWSLICQPDHQGRLLVHEEVPAFNIGLEKHLNESLRPRLMSDKYLGYRVALVGDPAGVAKDSISEESNIEACQRLGFPTFPAPTNDIDPRLRAVEALLARQTNGGPTLVLSAEGCPFLCRAMSGGYRYAKSKDGILKPKPDKENGIDWLGNKMAFSHVADTLQYVCLVVHGNMMEYIAQELYPRRRPKGPPITAAGWT